MRRGYFQLISNIERATAYVRAKWPTLPHCDQEAMRQLAQELAAQYPEAEDKLVKIEAFRRVEATRLSEWIKSLKGERK